MIHQPETATHRVLIAALLLSCALAGCKSKPAPADDNALSSQVQTVIVNDPSMSGQAIQATVQNGVATLTGAVGNDAQRELASRDAASITGIKQVLNNLTVQTAALTPPPTATAVAAPPPPEEPIQPKTTAKVQKIQPPPPPPPRQSAPIERPQVAYEPPPPARPSAPAPPPPPAFREVTLPAGSILPIRITQTLDSETTQNGDSFTGAVASDIMQDGLVAIPQGTTVSGHVDAVQEAAHFKGSSLLTVSLTTLNRRGEHISLATEPYSVEGKGRGKNTAIKTGIGAGAGAIIGGIFGGGKGAAIGAGAGAGVGAGSNAITRGEQVQIPSESLVRFRITNPITLRVSTRAQTSGDGLQPR